MIELFIGGLFRPAEGDCWFESFDPATEESLGRVALAGEKDVYRAVSAARDAFESGPWPRMPAAERAAVLLDMADCIEERLEALAKLETRDTGMPITITTGVTCHAQLPTSGISPPRLSDSSERRILLTMPM